MGCCVPSNVDQQEKTIDKTLMHRDKFTRKMLLLGAASTGKSTVFNQIRHIYGNQFEQKELLQFKDLICKQIINDIKNILMFIDESREKTQFPDLLNHCEHVQNIITAKNHDATTLFVNAFYARGNNTHFPEIIIDLIAAFIPNIAIYVKINLAESMDYLVQKWSNSLAKHVETIWSKQNIKDLVKIHGTIKLRVNDSTEYFLNNMHQISNENYIPNMNDIVRIGVHTYGIIEQNIEITSDLDAKIFQVGGLRSERKKWIHCFEEVAGIIFTVSLSCYDEYLFEDDSTNAMEEQITLFKEIVNSRWFSNTVMVVFFTKCDLFKEKIQSIPITEMKDVCKKYDFDGKCIDPNNYEQCVGFIQEIFEAQNMDASKPIYMRLVNALDTEMIKTVFSDTQQMILLSSLRIAS